MQQLSQDNSDNSNLLTWFANNSVAANLLMLCLVIGGLFIARNTTIETFPEIDPREISITVVYPGATPENIAVSINLRLEEAITGIEGIRKITSFAREGIGTVNAELEDHIDKDETFDKIQSAVNRIAGFLPQDADDVNISIVTEAQNVIVVAFYGDVSERNLREFAYDVRDELVSLEGISIAHVLGVRDYEIAIEINAASLRKYGLSFTEIADAVRAFSVNISAGKIQTEHGEILLRINQQAYNRADFDNIILRTHPNGSQIRLADVATVNDGFKDIDSHSLFNGKPAAYIAVERTGNQQVLAIEQTVKNHIAQLALPHGIKVTTWFNSADDLRSRIELLVSNGLLGLVLVFAVLVLFLNLKLAFWITAGIPIAFLGAFFIIKLGGGTVNMISLFAFIVVLGLVVDDAIIVGESIFTKREQGLAPMQAAIAGLMDVVSPITIGILTTVMAFLPLLFTTGFLGQLLSVVPLVVVSVLLMSLIEAFLILPSHLSNIKSGQQQSDQQQGMIPAIQAKLRRGLQHFIDNIYTPALVVALKMPYVAPAIAASLFLLVLGAINGGQIKTVFFPVISGNEIVASVYLPNGSPASDTEAVVQHLLYTAEAARVEYDKLVTHSGSSVIRNISANIGSMPFGEDELAATASLSGRSHLGEVVIELIPSEQRSFTATEFESRWREMTDVPLGVEIFFSNNLLNTGSDISVALSHDNDASLLLAVEQLKLILAQYDGVVDIQDTYAAGIHELQLGLTDAGLAAGLTLNELARQVRQAYHGVEAQRVQRGRDDIRVLVRYSDKERHDLNSIYNMRIRLGNGEELPFVTVATVSKTQSYAFIMRSNRKRLIEVDAEIVEGLANADEINAQLANEILPSLSKEFPGLRFAFEGTQKENQETVNSLLKAMVISLLSIFALLAVKLRSYTQPIIIMSVIPVGIVGAVVGHILLGFPISFLSFFGIIALSGVVINDSLILMDMINRLHAKGMTINDAVINGAKRRFRPIFFTSLTTCVGLAPIIAEQSVQAQFLIPMAISLAAGVLFATLITLFLIPSLCIIRVQLANMIGLDRSKSIPNL